MLRRDAQADLIVLLRQIVAADQIMGDAERAVDARIIGLEVERGLQLDQRRLGLVEGKEGEREAAVGFGILGRAATARR